MKFPPKIIKLHMVGGFIAMDNSLCHSKKLEILPLFTKANEV